MQMPEKASHDQDQDQDQAEYTESKEAFNLSTWNMHEIKVYI
jgi:hypothetical protein